MAPSRLLEVHIRNHLDHQGQKAGPVLVDCGETVKGLASRAGVFLSGPHDAAVLGKKL